MLVARQRISGTPINGGEGVGEGGVGVEFVEELFTVISCQCLNCGFQFKKKPPTYFLRVKDGKTKEYATS